MVESKDFIDITPPGVAENGKGVAGKLNTVFQDSELVVIRGNPGRLTKEGINEKIRIWSNSHNAHIRIFYQTMKQQCKDVAPSGMSESGEVIFARRKDGSPRWLGTVKKTKYKESKKKDN